jgi:hypothetical protein
VSGNYFAPTLTVTDFFGKPVSTTENPDIGAINAAIPEQTAQPSVNVKDGDNADKSVITVTTEKGAVVNLNDGKNVIQTVTADDQGIAVLTVDKQAQDHEYTITAKAADKNVSETVPVTVPAKKDHQVEYDAATGAANGKADGYQRKDAASNIGLSDAYCEAYTKAYNTAKAAADKAAGTEDGTADGKKGIKRDISKESKTYQDAYNSAYAANANPSEPISGTGVINQDHRNDGLYTQVPADGNDTFVGYEMAKQFTQQNVTLLRQVKIGKTTWVQVKLANGTLAWIDKRGLLINGNYDVQVADYDVAIVTAGRNDGLYTSVPTNPGDQFVGFKMAKVYDSQLGHVTETVVINGTKWLHVTIAGQSFWIDSKGTGKVPVTTSNQAAVIDQSKRNDGLYQTIGTVTDTSFKGLVMAKQYDQEKVTIIAEVTVGKTTWARVKLADDQLVWIDKDGLKDA